MSTEEWHELRVMGFDWDYDHYNKQEYNVEIEDIDEGRKLKQEILKLPTEEIAYHGKGIYVRSYSHDPNQELVVKLFNIGHGAIIPSTVRLVHVLLQELEVE